MLGRNTPGPGSVDEYPEASQTSDGHDRVGGEALYSWQTHITHVQLGSCGGGGGNEML